MMVRGPIPPPPTEPPPHEPSESEDDSDYDDAITIFEMQNSDKKPPSLESEGLKGQLPRHDSSSTCTTPGCEVGSTPFATLAKSKPNRSSSDTPAIPIRRSKTLNHCLLWMLLVSLGVYFSHSTGSLNSGSNPRHSLPSSGCDTTQNQPGKSRVGIEYSWYVYMSLQLVSYLHLLQWLICSNNSVRRFA